MILLILLLFSGVDNAVLGATGRIVAVGGDVSILRNGQIRDRFTIQVNDPIQDMDLFQTGFDGYITVEIAADEITSVIRIQENSVWYLESSPQHNLRGETRIRLLTGMIDAATSTGRNGQHTLVLDSRSAVVRVQEGRILVHAAPDDSIFTGVLKGRGRVNTAGRETLGREGEAFEVIPNTSPRKLDSAASDVFSVHDDWAAVRMQVFRAGAPSFTRAYARRFADTRDEFEAARQQLNDHARRLQTTLQQPGSMRDDMILRTEMSPAIIRVRSIAPLFEQTVYRLQELRRFHEQGIGQTVINGGGSADFFGRFASEERALMIQLSQMRALLARYGELERRSFEGLPVGPSELDNPFPEDGFLETFRF